MRWLEASDIYDDPDPEVMEWLELSRLARQYGKGPWEMVDIPQFWLDLARLDVDVQSAIQKKAMRKKE